jgi:mannose-6-phosphate isomerase-like protein (cupin superfamily)
MSTDTSTAVVVRTDEGQTVRWGPAGVIRILAGADSTNGSFSVVEASEPPGSAAPLHVHHAEAEAFYLIEGEVELTCGDRTVSVGAGDFVYTPKDVPHAYRVVGEQAARMLLLFTRPGFERFFAEGGAPLDGPAGGPPDPEVFRRLVERYDMELLGPPGGHA